MNLIEKLGLEKCKAIIDGAPETATDVILDGSQVFYGSGLIALRGAEQFFKLHSIRTAIADHEKCQHEWNETTSNGDAYRFFVCKHCDSTRNFIPLNEDITDYCSDIKNHLSPLTKVIER